MGKQLVPYKIIEHKIYLIRGKKVMLDLDLAALYGMETRLLKRAVRRNLKRFPNDFMFILNDSEENRVVSQIGIPSRSLFGGAQPFAFTEHGILMLSSVLNSEKAIEVNIRIMRIFSKLREILSTHKELAEKFKELEGRVGKHDEQITAIFEAIRQLIEPPESPKKRIGFEV